jgi:hypothetical protein
MTEARREIGLWPKVIAVAVILGTVGILAATVIRGGNGSVEVTVPAGTTLVGALESTVSTERARVGDRVELRTTEPRVPGSGSAARALPEGVVLRGEVTHAKGGGRIAGAPELTVRFTQLVVDGTEYPITAEPFRVRGKDDAKESALMIGGGTVGGAVVGAVAGDAVKGAVVGAVLGTGVAVATKGDQIVLPAGQRLRVRLTEPVTVTYRPEPEPKGRQD